MSEYGFWADTGEAVTREELEEHFDEDLNDNQEWWQFGVLKFAPSDILRELDPIAYRVTVSDYHAMLLEDGRVVEELPGPACENCGDNDPDDRVEFDPAGDTLCAYCREG